MAAGTVAAAPLVTIVGPTASGKTALAIKLAVQFNGEIICADSRTIYRGMNIGTAKPMSEEQQGIPHWGLDVVNPDQSYSAADFKQYAEKKINEIRARGKVPFLVGGTGLYVDAVLFDYRFGPKADTSRRLKLETMSLEALHEYCHKNNISLPENQKNKRYVIRAIERAGSTTERRSEPIANTIIVGITSDRGELRRRIQQRSEQLFEQGVVEEAKILGRKYGWDAPGMTGNIYQLVRTYLEGGLSLTELKSKNVTYDWRLAKRQLTWLRRNSFIQWYSLQHAEEYLMTELAKRP
jgi:tRNA dimethylallyltransferase